MPPSFGWLPGSSGCPLLYALPQRRSAGSSRDGLPSSSTLGLSSDLICPLSASTGTPDHFNCSVHSEEGEFTENDEYKVVLHASSLGENQTDVIFVKYKPRLHRE